MPFERVLIVEFGRRILTFMERQLATKGYKVYSFRARNECKIRERIVEQVENIAPDLLVIGVRPSPFPGSEWGRKYGTRFPIGLEAVELLRQSSNIPVVFINSWEEDPRRNPDLWERIVDTGPVAVERAYRAPEIQIAVALARGISEAKDRMRQSEERFQKIFESAKDAVFIKDRRLKYTLVNPAMGRLFDKQPSELIGLTDEDLFERKYAEHSKEVEQRVLQGEPIEEERSRRINEVELTFSDSRTPLRGASGEIVGICGISRNITERQKVRSGTTDIKYPSHSMTVCLKRA